MTTKKKTKRKKKPILNPWVYNGKEVTEEDIEGFAGFVYLIEDTETNLKYIGKKFFTSIRKQKGLQRRKRQESDWKTYYSSSKELQEIIETADDIDRFKRTILIMCKTEGDTNYMETKLLFDFNVLENTNFLNGNILGRYMRKPDHISEVRQYSEEYKEFFEEHKLI